MTLQDIGDHSVNHKLLLPGRYAGHLPTLETLMYYNMYELISLWIMEQSTNNYSLNAYSLIFVRFQVHHDM